MAQALRIQQHYYTRCREGVFRSNEGFDTVAVSPGLDSAFIKSVLHPYCYYKAPRTTPAPVSSLANDAEQTYYPPSLVVYPSEHGDLVIGQTVFVEADFTGQRSAFFTQQYVVPSALREEWLRSSDRIFRLKSFSESYDDSQGKSLPELENDDKRLLAAESRPENEPDRLLARLGLDRQLFGQLLLSVMASVTNRRKVYIVLSEAAVQAERDARELMKLVYDCLPYAYRRKLGVVTFSGEAEAKQHIHVTFLDKEALRQAGSQLERDVLFDLSAARGSQVKGADSKTAAPGLLEAIWHRRHSQEHLRELFDYCEQALEGLEESLPYSVSAYEELCRLFEIGQGEASLYDADRTGVWKALKKYLQQGREAGGKEKLHELLVQLLRIETGHVGRTADSALADAMLACEADAVPGEQVLLRRALSLFVMRALTAGGTNAGHELLDSLRRHPLSFRAFFQELYSQSAAAAEGCVSVALQNAEGSRGLMTELSFWASHADVLPVSFFAGQTQAALRRLVTKDSGKRAIETASGLFSFFEKLPAVEGLQRYEEYSELMQLELQLQLLEGLSLGELEAEDLLRMGFMLNRPDPRLLSYMPKGQRLTFDLWASIYYILTLKRGEEEQAEELLLQLGPLELERAQEFLRRAWTGKIPVEAFRAVTFAFYAGQERGRTGLGKYDFDRFLAYMAAQGGKDSVYDFIEWSITDPRFTGAGEEIEPHYRAALHRYFDRYDHRGLRQKEVSRRFLAVSHSAYRALFQEIKRRQAPKWQQLVMARRKPLAILLGLILLIAGLAGWKPAAALLISPVPQLQVTGVPDRTYAESVTLQIQATDALDRKPSIYFEGELIGQGQVSREVRLREGENVFSLKAQNKYGGVSETIRKTVVLEPLIGPPLPETKPQSASKSTGGSPAGKTTGTRSNSGSR
ncbi:hypothetical protein RAC89_20270 [Paenibacillus sp. GD4]|uniref:GAP1-N2 domain-containing protein n=1 Tax=Paenibacillus sp. GD4 TaxID=3068890 RepID=UPI00279692CF|nr:hypothetical protein [Paenibacillus sp. GD4]MDQ1912729.1 hypothetical protein [Paenibacillus sp. GD4]